MAKKQKSLEDYPHLLVPLFKCGYAVLVQNEEEYKQIVGDDVEIIVGENSGCAITLQVNNSTIYLIGVFDGKITTLVHELSHVVFFIYRDVGLEFDENFVNETYAYLLDELFNDLHSHIKKCDNTRLLKKIK